MMPPKTYPHNPQKNLLVNRNNFEYGSDMKRLKSFDKVVEALGGPAAVRELTHANPKQAWNWNNKTCKFPARLHACMTDKLRELGYEADPRLWNQDGY